MCYNNGWSGRFYLPKLDRSLDVGDWKQPSTLYAAPRRIDVSLLQHLREQSSLISARATLGPSVQGLGQLMSDAAVPPDLTQLSLPPLPPPSVGGRPRKILTATSSRTALSASHHDVLHIQSRQYH